MNIDGLSEATLEKFIARGFIRDFGDIFEIDRYKDEIIQMEGFGEKSYENLIESLNRAKRQNFREFCMHWESRVSELPMQR